MKSEENIDDLARNLLHDEVVTPPDAIWNNIEGQLPAQGKRFGPLFLIWIGLLVGVVLIGSLAAFFFWQEPAPELIRSAKKASGTEIDPAIRTTEKSGRSQPGQEQNFTEVEKTIPIQPTAESQNSTTAKRENEQVVSILHNTVKAVSQIHKLTADQPETRSKTPSQQQFDNPQLPKSEYIGGNAPVDLSTYQYADEILDHNTHHMAEIAAMIPRPARITPSTWLTTNAPHSSMSIGVSESFSGLEDPGSGHRTRWMIGTFADVRSTSLKINQARGGSDELVDALSSAEKASENLGGGITVGYQLSPKWRITSGIAFAKWCRTTKYPVSFSVAEEFLDFPAEAYLNIPMEQMLISATGLQNVQISVPLTTFIDVSTNSPANTNYAQQMTLEECHQLLHVPLHVAYQYQVGKLSYLPGAGLAYENVLNRSTRLLEEGEPFDQGSVMPAEAYRRHFLSFMASIHAEYQVSTHLSIRAGANYKSWITPLYESDLIRTYPRLISFDAGLVYTFYRR